MESSISEFLMWQLAYEQLPTYHIITSVLCVTVAIFGSRYTLGCCITACLLPLLLSEQDSRCKQRGPCFSLPLQVWRIHRRNLAIEPHAHTLTSAHACARARLCPTATAPTTTADHRGRRVQLVISCGVLWCRGRRVQLVISCGDLR